VNISLKNDTMVMRAGASYICSFISNIYMHVHEGNLKILTSCFIQSNPLCKRAVSVRLRLKFYGLQPMGLRQLKASRDEVKLIYSEKLLHVYKQNEDISMLNYLYKTGSINNIQTLFTCPSFQLVGTGNPVYNDTISCSLFLSKLSV
jgi:hypothetical protein